jgi:hypothetical protein
MAGDVLLLVMFREVTFFEVMLSIGDVLLQVTFCEVTFCRIWQYSTLVMWERVGESLKMVYSAYQLAKTGY